MIFLQILDLLTGETGKSNIFFSFKLTKKRRRTMNKLIMKKLTLLIILILFSVIIFMSIDFDENINYANIATVKFSDLKKEVIKPDLIDISDKIKLEKVELSEKQVKYIFQRDVFNWVLKKYDNVITEKNMGIFRVFKDNKTTHSNILFNDKFGNKILKGGVVFSILEKNKKEKPLLYFGDPDAFEKHNFLFYDYNEKDNTYTLLEDKYKVWDLFTFPDYPIDVKGQWFVVISFYQCNMTYDDYNAYFMIKIINIQTKEMKILWSKNYDILQFMQTLENIYGPRYDVSKNKRYIYLTGTYEPFSYGRVFNPGGYVYDWWNNRFFMIYKKNETNLKHEVFQITNNIEDGYIYFEVRTWQKKEKSWEYSYEKNAIYYRIKAEELEKFLDNYK